MNVTLEPVREEYRLFRDQYDELIADLRRQQLDVRVSIHKIETGAPSADAQRPWDLTVRLGEVADAVGAVALITYAIRTRLTGGRPNSESVRRAIIYFPRDGKRAFHALEIPAADR